jgi:hypothetical protein
MGSFIGGNTKELSTFFFPPPWIAHFPAQYVFNDAQTYFGAAHYTLWVMLCTSLVYDDTHYKSQCYLFD